MSFLGSLLGLILAARAREASGGRRARWLILAAVAIGGTGIWMMHFLAMLGFGVPESVVRYDVGLTVASLLIAVVIVSLGLFVVGFGRPSFAKIMIGGVFTGLGVAAMHYTGMAAMQVGGAMTYDPVMVGVSVAIAVVASTVALWFAVVISGSVATVAAALLMGVAVCTMHYTGMAAVRVRLEARDVPVAGVNPFELLVPISVLACLVISTLAYATIGFTVQQENARADSARAESARVGSTRPEAPVMRARDLNAAAAILRTHADTAPAGTNRPG